MQSVVRDVGTVLDWMRGTRQLIASDDPRVKALAFQKFGLQTEADWNAKKAELLSQLDASINTAQLHASNTVVSGSMPAAEPYVPAEEFGARFQSAMAEHLNDRVMTATLAETAGAPVPYGPPEKFDSGDLGWIVVLFARLEEAADGKHVFIHSNDLTSFRYDLPTTCRVALFADWATGEPPALSVKKAIEGCSPDYTIHLGDTYYAGFEDEIRHNLIACWPGSVQYGKAFALAGNHEMYSGGNAYFDLIPILGQSASFFNLGNQYWRIIGLDTSWCERGGDTAASSWGELNEIQLPWLQAQIKDARAQNPSVKFILLTHHQLFSAFEGDALGQYLKQQLGTILTDGTIYGWFWGHEHRGLVYGTVQPYTFKARCIGHGAFPYSPCTDTPSQLSQFPLLWREQRCEPNNAWYGMRGFALLSFQDAQISLEYMDQTGSTQYKETWP
jgi:Calcineurin-like phosphoesterase